MLYDLEVPDFTKAPFSMSGLVADLVAGVGDADGQARRAAQAGAAGPPVALRAFPQNDEIALFAEVYDNAGATPHKVDITTTVTTDEGKVLFKTDEERDSTELGGKRGGYGYATRVPLKDLAPGIYVLKVEARSRLGTRRRSRASCSSRVQAPRPAPAR